MRARWTCVLIAFLLTPALSACAGNPVQDVAAGDHFTLVATADGTLWAWGLNDRGQVGDGTCEERTEPVKVKRLRDVQKLAAGSAHVLALRDGQIWAWGANGAGQLGNGNTVDRVEPERIEGLDDIVDVAAGYRHSAALAQDGTVWAWGDNSRGQVRTGAAPAVTTPRKVNGLADVAAIEANGYHTLALRKDGTVWAWGANSDGRLGDGTMENPAVPVKVKDLDDAVVVAAGAYHNAAVRKDGTVVAWGCNWSTTWQLADGTTMKSLTPSQVTGLENMPLLGKPVIPTAEPFKPLTDVVCVEAGGYHTLALKKDGTVWGWGYNFYWGQLGDGEASWRTNPVRVQGVTNAVAVAAGKYHTVVLAADGTVWTCGSNMHGSLGNGTSDTRPHPVPRKVKTIPASSAE